MSKKSRKKPAKQAGASPISGTVPPIDHRWKPGQSGNPKGRPPAGLTVREMINALSAEDLTEAQLRTIVRDPSSAWAKRTAANRMLRTLECGDIADFAGLLRGENNLEDLRGMGINTEVVKKLKQKTRVVPIGDGKTEEVIEREVELFDRAGTDFDRVCDRTEGKPTQNMQHTGPDGGPISAEVTHKFDYAQFQTEIAVARSRGAVEDAIPHRNGNGKSLHPVDSQS